MNNGLKDSAGQDSIFLKACRGEAVNRIPVWFMRQAGRSLPGYRALRKEYDVLTIAQTPELAAQVSMEPVELLGVDAAILFADIMLLPIAMGIEVNIVDAVGPVIDEPINTPEKIARLKPFDAMTTQFLCETIKILRGKLAVPLIGFSGAPFTLASYLIEGKPTRTWLATKRFMRENPEAWHKLMNVLSEGIVGYLRMQIQAGAQAVQIFDSWVGCLSPTDYREYVLPHVQRIFSSLAEDGVPRIHFGTNTAGILADFANVDCEVVGVDWRISVAEARAKIGARKVSGSSGDDSADGKNGSGVGSAKTLQGNLDPSIMLASWARIEKSVDALLTEVNPKQSYIFNLGHGVLPETNDATLKKLVDYIHGK